MIMNFVQRRIMLVLLLAFTLLGCTTIERNSGYSPDDAALKSLTIGRDTKAEVEAAIGVPATTGVLDDSLWVYSASRWHIRGYRAPEEVSRQIVVISFDGQGVLANIERFSLEDGRVIVLSRAVTDNPVKDLGFFRQLFGGLKTLNLGGNQNDSSLPRP